MLAPDAVGTLLEFLGFVAFNGRAHVEGRGALVDRLGTAVAAPAIGLTDDPRFPGTLPRAFDAEGVAKQRLSLIEDGVARAVVHDTASAALAGGASTGHALAPGGSTLRRDADEPRARRRRRRERGRAHRRGASAAST